MPLEALSTDIAVGQGQSLVFKESDWFKSPAATFVRIVSLNITVRKMKALRSMQCAGRKEGG